LTASAAAKPAAFRRIQYSGCDRIGGHDSLQ
jgi:hypothetical protein